MQVESTALPDVAIVVPSRVNDERGFFSETFNARDFAARFGETVFVQDNHSWSPRVGTIRGLHFQAPPHAQGKLVRVTRGRVLDVVVDIRRSSPAFGRHATVELSAANWKQLWVPPGFAHGFCTLEPDCEVLYKVTAFYAAGYEYGLAFDDPDLELTWPIAPDAAVLSEKDKRHPRLAELRHVFR